MAVNLIGKDILEIRELSAEEIYQLIETAMVLKRDRQIGRSHELLKGKTLAMVFQKPSLRTRVSFETAMNFLPSL